MNEILKQLPNMFAASIVTAQTLAFTHIANPEAAEEAANHAGINRLESLIQAVCYMSYILDKENIILTDDMYEILLLKTSKAKANLFKEMASSCKAALVDIEAEAKENHEIVADNLNKRSKGETLQ